MYVYNTRTKLINFYRATGFRTRAEPGDLHRAVHSRAHIYKYTRARTLVYYVCVLLWMALHRTYTRSSCIRESDPYTHLYTYTYIIYLPIVLYRGTYIYLILIIIIFFIILFFSSPFYILWFLFTRAKPAVDCSDGGDDDSSSGGERKKSNLKFSKIEYLSSIGMYLHIVMDARFIRQYKEGKKQLRWTRWMLINKRLH